MRRLRLALVLTTLCALSACALSACASKNIYYWGLYEELIYDMYAHTCRR